MTKGTWRALTIDRMEGTYYSTRPERRSPIKETGREEISIYQLVGSFFLLASLRTEEVYLTLLPFLRKGSLILVDLRAD